jgi:hypothetical protein
MKLFGPKDNQTLSTTNLFAATAGLCTTSSTASTAVNGHAKHFRPQRQRQKIRMWCSTIMLNSIHTTDCIAVDNVLYFVSFLLIYLP